ncbi:type I phosphomannose isomerase catalytic subunit [Thermotalea metallivorans]|uniref:Phosphohexomutase n=1 Tax=Thermotalea metallivorans TaxID=520762 RepID=A0A140L6S2_9FIRM|nr:type I phosphomannose isomerase catalytic subunit [Thermotalea metallivorans]KXG76247.1 Mannose-6-phosphate isomerase ManA [Thermotalea metallivorans]
MFYPLRCIPIYKEKVWGGRNLAHILHKELPQGIAVGESWEICIHQEGRSIIGNGQFAGRTLEELVREYPEEMLGENHKIYGENFPLLIKFIDANDKLSVQVHPDDAYALVHEGSQGKAEMWYIVYAEKGAKVIWGLKKGVDRQTFEAALKKNALEEVLEEREVKTGDLLFIPGGVVHGIGKGIILAEIQQNSDITYRIYDWNRRGLDGKTREIHLRQALEVIKFCNFQDEVCQETITSGQGWTTKIYSFCPYFMVEAIEIEGTYLGHLHGERFEIVICVEGAMQLIYGEGKGEDFHRGETLFLPARLGDYGIKGKGKILKAYTERKST